MRAGDPDQVWGNDQQGKMQWDDSRWLVPPIPSSLPVCAVAQICSDSWVITIYFLLQDESLFFAFFCCPSSHLTLVTFIDFFYLLFDYSQLIASIQSLSSLYITTLPS